jgi:hypothetical protein
MACAISRPKRGSPPPAPARRRRLAQFAQQLRQCRRAQLFAGAGQARQRGVELARRRRALFAGDAVPALLGFEQGFPGVLQQLGIDAAVAAFQVIRRHLPFQAPGIAQQARIRRRLGRGADEEQGVAQQRLGQAGMALGPGAAAAG